MAKNKKDEDIKNKILEAASDLIAQKGVSETSLGDICRTIGISKGTLYYYYKSKEDIVYEIADKHLTKVTDGIFTWLNEIQNDMAPVDMLKTVFHKIMSAETRAKSHFYLISDSVTNSDALKEKFREKYKEWLSLFEEGLRKNIDKDLDFKVLSHILLSMSDGLVVQSLVGINDNPLDEIFDFLISSCSKEK